MREDRIKEIFNYTGMKQGDFAKKIGVSQQMISDIFNNRKKAGEKIILGIIDNIDNINPLWLLKGEGTMLNEEKEVPSKVLDISDKKGKNDDHLRELLNAKDRIIALQEKVMILENEGKDEMHLMIAQILELNKKIIARLEEQDIDQIIKEAKQQAYKGMTKSKKDR